MVDAQVGPEDPTPETPAPVPAQDATKALAVKENGPMTPTTGANAVSDDRISAIQTQLDNLQRAHASMMETLSKIKPQTGPVLVQTRSIEELLNDFSKRFDEKLERIETNRLAAQAKGLVNSESNETPKENRFLAYMDRNE